MKIAIISDLHGEHPKRLVEKCLEEDFSCFAFLGDYDTPQIVDYLMSLRVPDNIVLMGNHDYHHNIGDNLVCRDFDSRAWLRYQDARDFIERWSLVEDNMHFGLKTSRFVDGIKIGFVHSSLQPGIKPSLKQNYLWGNLDTPKEQIENFRAMTSFNMDLLFRGHEHTPYILNINRGQNLSGVGVELDEVAKAVTRTTPGFDNPLVLGSDRRHVISVPAFKYRGYAIFDSETSSLEFRKYS